MKTLGLSGQAVHTAKAYPGFPSIGQLGVFLLPASAEWYTSQSQRYLPALNTRLPIFVHSIGEGRQCQSKVYCLRIQAR